MSIYQLSLGTVTHWPMDEVLYHTDLFFFEVLVFAVVL